MSNVKVFVTQDGVMHGRMNRANCTHPYVTHMDKKKQTNKQNKTTQTNQNKYKLGTHCFTAPDGEVINRKHFYIRLHDSGDGIK